MKSPVMAPIGSVAAAVSVTRKVRCSGVCPGVCSTWSASRPTQKVDRSLQQFGTVVRGVAVAPVAPAGIGQQQPGTGPPRELARAGDEIGVDVGFSHVRDPKPFGLGGLEVGLDAAIRVHHQRLAGGLAAEEVTGLRELVVVEASEEHVGSRVGGRHQRSKGQSQGGARTAPARGAASARGRRRAPPRSVGSARGRCRYRWPWW